MATMNVEINSNAPRRHKTPRTKKRHGTASSTTHVAMALA
jgi:hypothetical protein